MSAVLATYNDTITDQIRVTDSAKEKLIELLGDASGDGMEAVRVFVSGGGCGGMTYGMTFTDQRASHDAVMDASGLKMYVDAVALNYLSGAEIDFVERPMGGASFVFRDVFAAVGGTGACGGCGGASGGGCA